MNGRVRVDLAFLRVRKGGEEGVEKEGFAILFGEESEFGERGESLPRPILFDARSGSFGKVGVQRLGALIREKVEEEVRLVGDWGKNHSVLELRRRCERLNAPLSIRELWAIGAKRKVEVNVGGKIWKRFTTKHPTVVKQAGAHNPVGPPQ